MEELVLLTRRTSEKGKEVGVGEGEGWGVRSGKLDSSKKGKR